MATRQMDPRRFAIFGALKWLGAAAATTSSACGSTDSGTAISRDPGDASVGGANTGGARTGGAPVGGSGGVGPGASGGMTTTVDGSAGGTPGCRSEPPLCKGWTDAGCVPEDWATAAAPYWPCSSDPSTTTYIRLCPPYEELVTPTFEGEVVLYFDGNGRLVGGSSPSGAGYDTCVSYDPSFTSLPGPLQCIRFFAECVPDAGSDGARDR